jgi:MFS family permease
MFSVLRKDLRTSTAEGMASSVMVGIGETYLPVFVLALSGSQLACGLVSTVPLMIGAVLQLGSPWLMRKFGSYRRWVSLCALVQAAAFVPLLLAAVMGRMPLVLVFALVTVYWATAMGGSGPWNAWMETLVPPRVRARYFAWRTRVCQWGIALGFVGGGVALQLAEKWGIPLAVFALLFFMASASRFTSAGLLAGQREPQPPQGGAARSSLPAIFRSLADGANGRLLLYLMAAQAAVQVSSPYFNPYMLGELQFSYTIYVVVVCTAIVAKILFLPTVGRIADRLGVRRVFWISAAAIVPMPALWLVSNHCGYLIAVQLYSGMAWCAFDLATLLLFFETIPRQKRVDVLAYFNLANAAATAGGSLLGAGILAALGANRHAYAILFALSTIARALALVLLVRIPARTATGEAARAIPPPHYLRPAPARSAVRAAKARGTPEKLAGGLRP